MILIKESIYTYVLNVDVFAEFFAFPYVANKPLLIKPFPFSEIALLTFL